MNLALVDVSQEQSMLRISTIDSRTERRLMVEGELVQPWIEELRSSWISAGQDLEGRKLVIDLSNATVIGHDGKEALLEMMREGAKFTCTGVLTKYVLRQLAHICRGRDPKLKQAGARLGN